MRFLNKGGIDTSSDNPITANTVVKDKEGFVNGEKVIGTMKDTYVVDYVQEFDTEKGYILTNILKGIKITDYDVTYKSSIPLDSLVNIGNITPEKIVKGNTIFGVEGTAESEEVDITSLFEYQQCLRLANQILWDSKCRYKCLSYIESSGTQRIENILIASNSKRIEIEFQYTSNSEADDRVFGDDNLNPHWSFGRYRSGFRFIYGDLIQVSNMPIDTEKHTLYLSDSFKVDDTVYVEHFEQTDESIFVFGNSDGLRIFAIRQYDTDNETLIHDIVPVKDLITNKIGLYDKIDKKFYINTLSDNNFIPGAEQEEYADEDKVMNLLDTALYYNLSSENFITKDVIDTGVSQEELVDGYTVITTIEPTTWTNLMGVFGRYSDGIPHGIVGLHNERNALKFSHYAGDITFPISDIPLGEKSFIVCIFNGNGTGKASIYFNGELKQTSTSFADLQPNGNVILGEPYTGRKWNGIIHNFALFKGVLNDTDIKLLSIYFNS